MLNFFKRRKKEPEQKDLDFLGSLKYQVIGTQGIFDELKLHNDNLHLIEAEINKLYGKISTIEKNLEDIKELFKFHQSIIFRDKPIDELNKKDKIPYQEPYITQNPKVDS